MATTKPVLGMVDPETWRKRTSLTFSKRGPSTLKVDAAYAAYYASHSPTDAAALYRALEAYLVEKGRHWSRSDRDKASGGLMQYMHQASRAAAGNLVPARTESAPRAALNRVDIPHSRYGVLYLFGNLAIGMDESAAKYEGVGKIGGAFGHVFGDGYKVQGMDSKTLITGASTVIKAVPKLKANLSTSIDRTKIADASPIELRSIAKQPAKDYLSGVNYNITRKVASYSATQAVYHSRSRVVRKGASRALAVGTTAVLETAATITVGAVETLDNLRRIVINALNKFVEWIRLKLVAKIRGKMVGKERQVWQITGAALRELINRVAKHILAEAMPVLTLVKDIGGGIIKTLSACKESFGAWYERRSVPLNPGHPELIANSIQNAMKLGIFEGLYEMLKGAAKTAVHAFLPGLGMLVNAIVAGVEFIVKFIMRKTELGKIAVWLKEAKELFLKERALAIAKREEADRALRDRIANNTTTQADLDNWERPYTDPKTNEPYKDKVTGKALPGMPKRLDPELDPRKGGIVGNLKAFSEFFQRGCEASPMIAILALNSGICGSLMVFLAMFADSDDDKVISQAEFDKGAQFFARLKDYGRRYMANAGFSYSSDDPFIRQLVQAAKVNNVKDPGMLEKGMQLASGFVSGPA